MELQDLSDRFARYLAAHLPDATDVQVAEMARIHGGASRETYRCRASWNEGDHRRERGLILRRDPLGSLIETERDVEYTAYAAFRDTPVPVPGVLFLETDGRWLERPFFVMEMVDGAAANPFLPEVYGAHSESLGRQFWTILGHIAAADVQTSGLASRVVVPEASSCWRQQLEYWEKVIDEDELEPQPIARAAIRWLRRNPPPPAPRLCVVHGDYRSGNFLSDGEGKIRAILDWEMCHVGDPHEDLGWACDPLWACMDANRPAQLIPKAQALRLWEQASGLVVDPVALRWWEVFAHVKGLAIWISSSKEYVSGNNKDPVLLLSGWLCTERHNRILSAKLASFGR